MTSPTESNLAGILQWPALNRGSYCVGLRRKQKAQPAVAKRKQQEQLGAEQSLAGQPRLEFIALRTMGFHPASIGQSQLTLPNHIVPCGAGALWAQVALQRSPILRTGAYYYSQKTAPPHSIFRLSVGVHPAYIALIQRQRTRVRSLVR